MNNYLIWGSGDDMKPSTADVIDSIIWSLDTYVAPEVEAPFASSVLITVGNLLRHVKLRVQQEPAVLSEDNADLATVLHQATGRLEGDSELQAALSQPLKKIATTLDQTPENVLPPRSAEQLSDDSDALRQALDDFIRALGALTPQLQERPGYGETRQQIRAYLARQLKREGSLITPAFTGGRR